MSSPNPPPPPPHKALSISSEHRLRSENLAFDIDVWYPRLAGLTPRSVFTPLTRTEAEAILCFQQTRYLGRSTLTQEHLYTLRALETRLNNVLKAEFPTGAMLRLCGRSPKDGDPLDRAGIFRKYQEELKKLLDAGECMHANTKLRAIAKVPFMKVRSGKEVMCMLLSSERVFTECRDWLEYGEPEQVVFREWIEDMTLDYEFRVYVNNGVITAISQYDHYSVYPHLHENKAKLERLIREAWAEAHPRVAESAYVIDFAYLHSQDRMVVIELSPFLPCTGAALFSWKVDGDRLRNGPFEFRLNETQRHGDDLEDVIEANWVQRWQKPSDEYEEWIKGDSHTHRPPPPLGGFSLNFWIAAGLCAVGALSSITGFPDMSLMRVSSTARAAIAITSLCVAVPLVDHALANSFGRRRKHRTLLFVYGTLKRGFHWHTKFLSFATYLGNATTLEPMPLVIGDCGVPYLLTTMRGQGSRVRGELYAVDESSLLGLDEYEGIGKGYYSRTGIQVQYESGYIAEAQVYSLTSPPQHLTCFDPLPEYTLDMHQRLYNAVQHIRVKQELYLGEDPDFQRT